MGSKLAVSPLEENSACVCVRVCVIVKWELSVKENKFPTSQ